LKLDFSNIKILLIGDFMIDYYLMGVSSRMSPEAPVPVLNIENDYSIPGGAGNVAMNLSKLGANVACYGVIGDDLLGENLISILKSEGINVDGIVKINNHPTTTKQRIYSNGKQVVRIDKEKILTSYKFEVNKIDDFHACIFSDYNKGVVNTINLDKEIIVVDPKKSDFSEYKNAKIITPNLEELRKASKIKIIDDDSVVKACKILIDENNFEYIIAKKGSEGMTIVGKNNLVKHIPANYIKNPDVTGAGDTVISAFTLAYAKTKDIVFSCNFANNAAAAVVSKIGTATVTIDEINNYINGNE
tara:strand:- start:1987 stop:2895 length:909 start_codon:yes stop_codon:yes gene_type:complete